jgi:hypothetical protein
METKINTPYRSTRNLHKALANNYIGEVVVTPNVLTNAVRKAMRLPLLVPVTIYYYGQPNNYIQTKFGIPTV